MQSDLVFALVFYFFSNSVNFQTLSGHILHNVLTHVQLRLAHIQQKYSCALLTFVRFIFLLNSSLSVAAIFTMHFHIHSTYRENPITCTYRKYTNITLPQTGKLFCVFFKIMGMFQCFRILTHRMFITWLCFISQTHCKMLGSLFNIHSFARYTCK